MLQKISEKVAVVIIGRNEGGRLQRCLRSVTPSAEPVIYVDSGSLDRSPGVAAAAGCIVLELDAMLPFSAARARNEGFDRLMQVAPEARFVQFLDGDCEVETGWLERGAMELEARPDVGIVCGQVREIHPEKSVYNRLCDLEWRQEPGEILSAGGRFMVRSDVFRAVGGFRPEVIAAEDDEFCIRVRRLGWKIVRVDAGMARHDAAMTRFGQWFHRARRTGHAYAQVAALHGKSQERYFVSDLRKLWFWGLALPALALAGAYFTRGLTLAAVLCAYAAQFARIYGHGRRRGWQPADAALNSFFTVISRFPALVGALEYHGRRWRGDDMKIIEYKRS